MRDSVGNEDAKGGQSGAGGAEVDAIVQAAAADPGAGSDLQISRERLLDGSLLSAFRASMPAGVLVRSDADLESTLAQALSRHDRSRDLLLFGYGSLMWNPAFDHQGGQRALVHGWRRRFCLQSLLGRGSATAPGVMLALDRGGACAGVAFRIDAAKVEHELRLVWRREMLSGVYHARWLTGRIAGQPVPMLSFVANREHERYLCNQGIADTARLIATGRGALGTCRAYFDAMIEAMATYGIRDAAMEALRRALPAAPPVLPPTPAEAAVGAAGTGSLTETEATSAPMQLPSH